MAFKPTDLHLEILAIVHGLQHGKGRRREGKDSPVVLDDVPEAVIQAELSDNEGSSYEEDEVTGALNELVTRELLVLRELHFDYWPLVKYQRSDGKMISTHQSGAIPEVRLDGKVVALGICNWDPHNEFPSYEITNTGLRILDEPDRGQQRLPCGEGGGEEHTATLGDADDGAPYYRFAWFKKYTDIPADTLKKAKSRGDIRVRSESRYKPNYYSVPDARKQWPQLFHDSKTG